MSAGAMVRRSDEFDAASGINQIPTAMSRGPHKPDLVRVACQQLAASTTFRLGRKRLVEDTHLTARQLLSQTNHFCEVYEEGGKPQEIAATLRLLERADSGADTWALDLLATLPRKSEAKPRPSEIRGRPTGLLLRLGKLGLEADFNVNAAFIAIAEQVAAPPLPAPVREGAFSHIVGYTLAKIGELEQVLYEVNVRSLGKGAMGLIVGFTYRRTIDQFVYEAILNRATEIRRLIERPKAPEPAQPAQGEAATPEPQTKDTP